MCCQKGKIYLNFSIEETIEPCKIKPSNGSLESRGLSVYIVGFMGNVNFSLEVTPRTVRDDLPEINDIYVTFLPGTDFFDAKYDMVEDINKQFWKTKPHLNTMTFREVYYRRKKISEISEELGYKTQSEDVFMSTMERDFARWKYNEEFNCLNEVNDNFDNALEDLKQFMFRSGGINS